MELEYVRKKNPKPLGLFFFFIVLVLMVFSGAVYLYPAFVKVPPTEGLRLIIDNSDLGKDKTDVINGDIYLPYRVVKEHLDPAIFWEKDTGKVIVTTKDKVIRMAADAVTARVNSEEMTLQAPVREKEGKPWIPVEFLAPLYQVDIKYYPGTRRVVITRLNRERKLGRVSAKAKLRTAPGFRNPWLDRLESGDVVEVFGRQGDYLRVRTAAGGLLGYVAAANISITEVAEPGKQDVGPVAVWQPPAGERVNLTWEFVTRDNPDTAKIPLLPGVNVVSPTWFYLSDTAGNVGNRAGSNYVSWAHRRGYQVWALFSNDFNRDRTHAVLAAAEKREKVIDQLLVYAQLYRLDGLNIDFENVYVKDGDLLVQFVRELVPLAHQQGLVVSIDVTVKSGSANYSLFYDREALGEAVDYVILMTYDEHWASSPEAGSVASLPWVERGVLGLLEEVPRDKLILGVPFYTRLWIEKEQEDGSVRVQSKALSMKAAAELIAGNGAGVSYDEAAGQHYATWQRGGVVYEIWLENENSMRQRAALVKKYGLAGIASWRRGFEKDNIWEVILEEIK